MADYIIVTDNQSTREGLEKLLLAALGDHGHVLPHVEIGTALLIIELAKRAEDRSNWFPRGKWATIQSIQNRVENDLKNYERLMKCSSTP